MHEMTIYLIIKGKAFHDHSNYYVVNCSIVEENVESVFYFGLQH